MERVLEPAQAINLHLRKQLLRVAVDEAQQTAADIWVEGVQIGQCKAVDSC